VRPERFELPTFWFVARRSIQLSYERTVASKILPCQPMHDYTGRGKSRIAVILSLDPVGGGICHSFRRYWTNHREIPHLVRHDNQSCFQRYFFRSL
jgi:hypothetical protein